MSLWGWYQANREDIRPLLAPLGSFAVGVGTIVVASVVAWTTLRQVRIANLQADIARKRHEEQTKADFQRRITETFGKGVEQLGGEKVDVRVAGIYTLERLAREDAGNPEQMGEPGLYWTVMEILTAFVRVNAGPTDRTTTPAADIAAVLAVMRRRPENARKREKEHRLRFDLKNTDLQGADLRWTDLAWADLTKANLSNVQFTGAKLRNANLQEANLSGANLSDHEIFDKAEAMAALTKDVGFLTFAYLTTENWAKTLLGTPFRLPPADRRALIDRSLLDWTDRMADLGEANLLQADLREAKLGGACLYEADLRKAKLGKAILTAADLTGADLTDADLTEADLKGANLKGAFLSNTRFAGAKLDMVELAGANLTEAHFEGTDLTKVPLDGIRLDASYGDAQTLLPRGVPRPVHWGRI